MELDTKQIKAIVLTLILISFVILIFIVIAIFVISNFTKTNTNINIQTGFNSIKEIIEFHESKYISDTYSKNREYPEEINLVFKYNLYEGEESKEDFYNKLIQDLSTFLNYINFKLVDNEKNIEIEVICIDNMIDKIIIDGREDYFIYMESMKNITEYKEIESISLNSNDEDLTRLLNNNWKSNTDFGTRDSIFKNYNIYFNKGIEVRKIGQSIYNIIYNKNHIGEVVNNISVGQSFTYIKNELGTPQFEDIEKNIIGYKGNLFYVFFTNDEISIYRNLEYDYTDFWNLIDKFLNDELNFKQFMNELTYLWKDYSEYKYDSDYMFISYPNKGIDIKLNYDNISGIIVYNNISEKIEIVKKYLNNTEFISNLHTDNVFEAEKRRINNKKEFEELYISYENEIIDNDNAQDNVQDNTNYNDNINLKEQINDLFYKYIEKDNHGYTKKIYFISKDGKNPNRELNETVNTYFWKNNKIFIYSISGKGIYSFNPFTGNIETIIEGNYEYKINSYKDGILKFDDENEIKID